VAGCDDTVFGVPVDGGTPDEITDEDAPTWHQDIRPLLADRCWGCHNDEVENPSAGVYSWEHYDNVAPLAGWIATKLEGDDLQPRYMPPFGVQETEECSPEGTWLDDWRLSEAEQALFERWVDAGTPEGDSADAVEAEVPPIVSLEGEEIETYTLQATDVDPGEDVYICFSLDLDLETTRWINGAEVLPDNRNVVHHVVLFTDPLGDSAAYGGPYPCYGGPQVKESQVIFAWAPGGQPMTLPESSGVEMQGGSHLIAQVHYHPGDTVMSDQSAIAIRWLDEQPTYLARMAVYGGLSEQSSHSSYIEDGEFLIPAGSTGHVETWRQPLELDGERRLWAVFPHMHAMGDDILITIEDDSGSRCLSHNDRWDFNWQLTYRYAGTYEELPMLDSSAELVIRCTYDNPTEEDVSIGEDTTDEMCLAILGFLEEAKADSSAKARMAYLVPGGPSVDVWVNGVLAVSGLTSGEGTSYLELGPGSYTVTLTAAGGSPDDASAVSFGPVTFNSEIPTTLVAYGELPDVTGTALADNSKNIAPEDIRIQAFHAAPLWPSLDVLSAAGDVLMNDFELGDAVTAPDQPAGAYTLGIDLDEDGLPEATFSLPEISGGSFVNIYLFNDGDDVPYLLVHGLDGTIKVVPAD
jgi:hypothetical protein